jgi:hypothetical protein
LLLRHSASLEQKQPPPVEHSLVDPLQWPNGHENPVAVELGHPPSGQGGAASGWASYAPSPPESTPPSVPASAPPPSIPSAEQAPLAQTASISPPPASPPSSPDSVSSAAPASPASTSDGGTTLASHSLKGHSPVEYAFNPEIAAHAPRAATTATAPTAALTELIA